MNFYRSCDANDNSRTPFGRAAPRKVRKAALLPARGRHAAQAVPSKPTVDMRRTRFISACLSFVACVIFLAARAQKDEEIARLGKVMGWKAGQVIADVGAGEGEFGFGAARVVGETGKVYLTELDEKKRKALEDEAKRREAKNKVVNVVVVQAAEKQTNLPDNCCDGIILRRVYHHFTAPDEMDASLLRSLKPGGVLAVIEFPPRKGLTESDPVKGVPPNRGGHGIPQKILVAELTHAGFAVDQTINDWPDDSYCVVFRKTAH
jgi:ubiquinone/menaquinone biosynthesis C-methylase UbiE